MDIKAARSLTLAFLPGRLMNTLYYGNNLKILRDYIKDETVDFVDPPFNSNRNYTCCSGNV